MSASNLKPGTVGVHMLPAIPPYLGEFRVRAEYIGPSPVGGGRIRLRDLEMAERGCSYLIDTTPDSFIPDGGKAVGI